MASLRRWPAVSISAAEWGAFLAGAFFLRRFCQRGHSTDWLFAAHTTLMGTSALLFELSAVWDAAWWWWHVLRLLAYLAALSFAVRAYLDAEQAIVSLNRQLKELNCTLDRTVEARTAELQASQERFASGTRLNRRIVGLGSTHERGVLRTPLQGVAGVS